MDTADLHSLNFEFNSLIDSGEDPRKVLNTVIQTIEENTEIEKYALFLPSESGNSNQSIYASSSTFSLQIDTDHHIWFTNRSALTTDAQYKGKESSGRYHYFDIPLGGKVIGTLVIVSKESDLSAQSAEFLSHLCYHIAILYERINSNLSLQTLLDRLQILTELNQLIGKNVSFKKIAKTLAREAAYKFRADLALTLVLNERGNFFNVEGSFGSNANLVPEMISSQSGIFGHVMKTGGHISIQSLDAHVTGGVDLSETGIRAVDICCLEVRGENLGAFLLGYKAEQTMPSKDSARFEEFCQAAAVAISNAKAQERITQYTEKLEEIVNARTADLAVQTELVEEANKAKSTFLANMSHELRTPLTSIIGFCSVVQDGFLGDISEQQIEALKAITHSCDHLTNLIDDVLNIEKIELGVENYNPENINVYNLLQHVYQLLLQTAVNKSIALQALNISEEVLRCGIFADPKHIQQIVINLVSNAIKYTPEGGKVWVAATIVDGKVQVSVSDTGVGIPESKKNKLFERFERGEDTYSKSQEGTGIGLSLTKQLVEINGGTIGVESELNKGSTFWIRMPRADSDQDSNNKVEIDSPASNLTGLSILLVDDNRDCCEVLNEVFTAKGASVEIAHTATDCFSALEKSKPQIFITDIGLKNESGITLITDIKERYPAFSQIPIIVISACSFPEDKKLALDAGASIFISKPFKPLDVVSTIIKLAREAI